LFIKYTTNQNQKGKGCALKDLILDCVQKITEPSEREDENGSADHEESLAIISPAPSPSPLTPHKRLPVKDPADCSQLDLKLLKWFMFFTKFKKNDAAMRKCRILVST
jgi:hypothetical protein